MAFRLVAVISLFGVFASTNGFAIPQDSDLHKASVNITESALATDCGDRDYYDIRAKTRLYFFANRKVRRRSAPVENNKQLQCQDPENCLEGVGLVEAICLNAHNESSNPHWICEGALPNMRYRFYKTIVDCEPHPDPKIPCVLRGSCILIYEPFKPMSNFLIIAITTFIVSIVVCIFVSIKAVRRHRAESRAPPSAAADTVQNNYDPSTDIPPSYNTVERNPRRYSKPNLTVPVKQSEPETPPPPYETCSDKSLPL